jgi:hypothetical protein
MSPRESDPIAWTIACEEIRQLAPIGRCILQVTNVVIDVVDGDRATGIVGTHAELATGSSRSSSITMTTSVATPVVVHPSDAPSDPARTTA